MTKLETADEIIKQKGDCFGINCYECCLNGSYDCFNLKNKEEFLKMAIKYKKEHENDT